jgi:hypothetical protein
MDWPNGKLQVCKFVLIEFAPQIEKKITFANDKKFSHLQMDKLCHFDFCHNRRNDFCCCLSDFFLLVGLFDIPYSREQKHVLLFRKSDFLIFKVSNSNMPQIFFRNKTFLFVVRIS